MKTYDVVFNNETDSNSKGFKVTFQEAVDWINANRGSGYFKDYAGGTVSVVCNENDDEAVYSESI